MLLAFTEKRDLKKQVFLKNKYFKKNKYFLKNFKNYPISL